MDSTAIKPPADMSTFALNLYLSSASLQASRNALALGNCKSVQMPRFVKALVHVAQGIGNFCTEKLSLWPEHDDSWRDGAGQLVGHIC